MNKLCRSTNGEHDSVRFSVQQPLWMLQVLLTVANLMLASDMEGSVENKTLFRFGCQMIWRRYL
jgi:hypothetical protein